MLHSELPPLLSPSALKNARAPLFLSSTPNNPGKMLCYKITQRTKSTIIEALYLNLKASMETRTGTKWSWRKLENWICKLYRKKTNLCELEPGKGGKKRKICNADSLFFDVYFKNTNLYTIEEKGINIEYPDCSNIFIEGGLFQHVTWKNSVVNWTSFLDLMCWMRWVGFLKLATGPSIPWWAVGSTCDEINKFAQSRTLRKKCLKNSKNDLFLMLSHVCCSMCFLAFTIWRHHRDTFPPTLQIRITVTPCLIGKLV